MEKEEKHKDTGRHHKSRACVTRNQLGSNYTLSRRTILAYWTDTNLDILFVQNKEYKNLKC